SQFTGPPCQDIRSANWRSASANCCGSPSGPNGPPSAGGPPEEPEPPDPPLPRPWPGRPKPKGGSAICVASQAGWNGHATHVIPGAAPVSTAPAPRRPRRPGMTGRADHDDPAGAGGAAGEPRSAPPPAAEASAGQPTAELAVAQPARGRPAPGPGPVVAITGAAHGLG